MGNFVNKKALWVSIAISVGTGLLVSLLTIGNFDRYSEAVQPFLSPPGWLFPIVWSILYILMGISAYLIYISNNEQKYIGLSVYAIQLIFNFLWSIIYFNMGQILFAFIWLIILWILIIVMIKSFYKVNKTSAFLQIPYLLWVTFAGYLILNTI
ncbi:MAG: TspO/MBR family protein [Acutalibacteraceae bacterium]|nr:TspO/MBR family protein [Acutalibacteraceae bacterium]